MQATGERVTTLEKAEACRAKLADMRHGKVNRAPLRSGGTDEVCLVDHQPWPCDAARLLDYAEARLKRATTLMEEIGRIVRKHPSDVAVLAEAEQEVSDLARFLGVAE